jgi:hypothetical protein
MCAICWFLLHTHTHIYIYGLILDKSNRTTDARKLRRKVPWKHREPLTSDAAFCPRRRETTMTALCLPQNLQECFVCVCWGTKSNFTYLRNMVGKNPVQLNNRWQVRFSFSEKCHIEKHYCSTPVWRTGYLSHPISHLHMFLIFC